MAARPNQHPPPGAGANPDAANHYEMLGVRVDATSAEITRAYRDAMKRYHPDRVRAEYRSAAEDVTKDLNLAYATLSDPVRRLDYDKSIRHVQVQDEIMRRYVGGFLDPAVVQQMHAQEMKREASPSERQERRRNERSAITSLFAIFVIVTLGAIGLMLLFSLIMFIVGELT